MIVEVLNLPTCQHCKAQPVLERLGDEGAYTWFVMCKSEDCAKRENGAWGAGRPLSNGKPSQYEAERDWRTIHAEAVAHGAQ